MARDVFISHASPDREAANLVCAALEADGVSCWMAPRDVLPGSSYASSIIEAIGEARVMVVLSSSAGNESPHVSRELERAVSRGLMVLPVRIEDVAPSAAVEYFIASSQWLDAFPPPIEAHLPAVVTAVRRMLTSDGTAAASLAAAMGARPDDVGDPVGVGAPVTADVRPVESSTVPEPAEPGRPRWKLAAVGGLVAIAVIGAAVLALRKGEDSAGAGSTAPTTTVFESAVAGLQAKVEYDVPDVQNTTPALAAKLADTPAVLAPLGASPIVVESLTFQLKRTPATVRYQAFNPLNSKGCSGFMSRPITVTGLWQKDVTFGPGSAAKLNVMQFADEAQAREAFAGFSIEQGPVTDECRGLRKDFGVADYEKLQIRHQEPRLEGLPAGTDHNAWLVPLGDKAPGYDFVLATVSQRNNVVVLMAVLSSTANGLPSAQGTAQVLSNIIERVDQ